MKMMDRQLEQAKKETKSHAGSRIVQIIECEYFLLFGGGLRSKRVVTNATNSLLSCG